MSTLALIGIGLTVERFPDSPMISAIQPQLDGFVSMSSFREHRLRSSAYKAEFTHWLPLYIEPTHGARALSELPRALALVMGAPHRPLFALKVLPAVMNTMVVSVMGGSLHQSLVALEGYAMFFHLLLACVRSHPPLQRMVDEKIHSFLTDADARSKRGTPILGEWIALLSVSDRFSWADVRQAYLRESTARQAKWLLKAHPFLRTVPTAPTREAKKTRVDLACQSSEVGRKLCMFHVCFLRMFRHSARNGALLSTADAKSRMDAMCGRPSHSMQNALQKQIKAISALTGYDAFYSYVGVDRLLSLDDLYNVLLYGLRRSARLGYHR